MRRLFWLLTVTAAAVAICGPIGDPDLWWHIVVGRWIIANGAVPTVDLWNEFGAGSPWRAYSWSNEALYALINDSSGIQGLMIAKIVLSLLLTGSLAYAAGKIARDFTLGLLLGIPAAAACYAHFGLRPQAASWICFVWLLYLADRVLRKKLRKSMLIAAMGVALVWANTHLSLIVGLGAVTCWLLDLRDIKSTYRNALWFGGAVLVGSLITPYFGGEWLTLVTKAEHPFSHMYIQEFQPATLYHAAANIVLLLFAVLLVLVHNAPQALSITQLLGSILFLFGALTVQKFIPFAGIYQCFLIARLWRLAERPGNRLGNPGRAIGLLVEKASKSPSWLLLSGCLVLALLTFGYLRPLLAAPLDQRSVAEKPLDFIREHQLALPILNTFNDGGYVLYRYSLPDGTAGYRVPLDGRTNINTPEASAAFLTALYGRTNWKDYFELVKPRTVLWDNNFPLVSILLETADWCHVYPPADKAISSSRWSVFVDKEQFAGLADEVTSRNCARETGEQ